MIMQTLTWNNEHTFSSVRTQITKSLKLYVSINNKIHCGYYIVREYYNPRRFCNVPLNDAERNNVMYYFVLHNVDGNQLYV